MSRPEDERRVLRQLRHACAAKLSTSKNRAKPMWTEDSVGCLINRLREEVGELHEAWLLGESNQAVISECADVANFAAFIIDVVCREGDCTPPGRTHAWDMPPKRAALLAAILDEPGSTFDELKEDLGWSGNEVGQHAFQLSIAGFIQIVYVDETDRCYHPTNRAKKLPPR